MLRRMNLFLKGKKMNNAGSAMVTVIVVVLFVTLLASTLVYISGMNYQIKQTDYKNKKSFYDGETYMETLKAELMKDVSNAAVKAYNDTMTEYISLTNKDIRTYNYYQKFIENLINTNAAVGPNGIWVDRSWDTWLNTTSGIIPAGASGTAKFELTVDLDNNNGDIHNTWKDITDASHTDAGYLVLRGIKLTYTNANGYTTEITTNIYVDAPDFEWSVNAAETTGTPDTKFKEVDISECVKYVNWQKQ